MCHEFPIPAQGLHHQGIKDGDSFIRRGSESIIAKASWLSQKKIIEKMNSSKQL
jgi:hypothetical protein